MTNQHSFVSSDRFDRDLYTSSKTAERVLNAAIVRTEITESFEEYVRRCRGSHNRVLLFRWQPLHGVNHIAVNIIYGR